MNYINHEWCSLFSIQKSKIWQKYFMLLDIFYLTLRSLTIKLKRCVGFDETVVDHPKYVKYVLTTAKQLEVQYGHISL